MFDAIGPYLPAAALIGFVLCVSFSFWWPLARDVHWYYRHWRDGRDSDDVPHDFRGTVLFRELQKCEYRAAFKDDLPEVAAAIRNVIGMIPTPKDHPGPAPEATNA